MTGTPPRWSSTTPAPCCSPRAATTSPRGLRRSSRGVRSRRLPGPSAGGGCGGAAGRAWEAVTGPKREWWLVETVGLLVTVAGGAMLAAGARRRTSPEVLGVAAGSAASLAAIDIVYVARGRIAPSYLADAAVQLGLLGALARRASRGSFPPPGRG